MARQTFERWTMLLLTAGALLVCLGLLVVPFSFAISSDAAFVVLAIGCALGLAGFVLVACGRQCATVDEAFEEQQDRIAALEQRLSELEGILDLEPETRIRSPRP